MYLSDNDLQKKIPDLNIFCDNDLYPFKADEQIQPCSIDLRLSNVFWEPLGNKTIDLRKSHLLDLSPRRQWKKKILNNGEHVVLKPGGFLLGRTYEKFTIPLDCAGKIEGRSSFSRMGLGIHCTGDFINPKYRGHMTLQLFNYGPNPVKIFPYLPICQLLLIRLSNTPSRYYGANGLQSKYMDDDGGPSYWWRDKRIKSLQTTFQKVDLSIQFQTKIFEKIGEQEPEIIERLERFVETTPTSNLDNAEALLESFSKAEDRLKRKDKVLLGFFYAFFPIFGSASLGILFSKPYGLIHYVVWVLAVFSLWPFFVAIKDPSKQYLGEKELRNCLIQ